MNEPNMINLDDGWAIIQTEIDKLTKILDNPDEPQFKSNNYMKLYTIIYILCTENAPNDHSSELHARLKKVFEDYLTSTVFASLSDKQDDILLKEFARRWSNHKVMVQWLSRIFSFLDQYYLPNKNLPPLKEEGMVTFRNMFSEELSSKVLAAALSLIDRERDGGHIDEDLLWNVVHTFVELGMGKFEYYENRFESFMIQKTLEYYSRKVYEWMSQKVSFSDYMSKAEQCILREHDIFCYLHTSSEAKTMEIVQNQMYSVNQVLCFLKGFMDANKIDDLSRMYELLSNVTKGLDNLSSAFEQFVTAEGMTLVKDAEGAASKAEDFIKKIIELQGKYRKLVNDCFKNDTLFRKALTRVMKVLCNKDIRGKSVAGLLAIVSVTILKNEKLSQEAIEALGEVFKLVEYIDDKELFAQYYRRFLATRLLFSEGAKSEFERSILSKLKHASGLLTIKMEKMLNDFTAGSDRTESSLTKYLEENTKVSPGIKLTVTELNSFFWPNYKTDETAELNLPEEMVNCNEVLMGFLKLDKSRKFRMAYSWDTCIIVGQFDAKPLDLIVTTYQASALLLFNTSDRLSYKEIMRLLNLPAADVDRILKSLSCARSRILIKKPTNNNISSSDCFEFNSKFTIATKRIKIPLPPLKEKENKDVEVVERNRRYEIDAAIVRIMKARKVLRHQQLLDECIKMLKQTFQPDVKAMKKRIEELITRGYLKRDTQDSSVYKYVP